MPSTRTQLRRRRAPAPLDVLPVDPRRRARGLDGIRIDGRAIDLIVGERLTAAKYVPTIEGANTLTLSLLDDDRRVLTSGVLGTRVMTRIAEVTVDGLTYTIAGLSRSGDTLTLTCEDAIVTHLKRHGRGKPRSSSRGKHTRAGFCAELIREAGVRCLVLDEDVIQPRKGARKLRDELARARRDVAGDRETKGRSSTIGLTARGITVKGKPATRAQRRNIARVIRRCGELDAPPRATLAAVLAPIGEANYDVGAAEQVYGTHKGLYQSNVIAAADVEQQVEYFLRGGRSFQAGGAIAAARAHPDWSIGQIVTAVEASGEPGSYYEGPGGQWLAEARKMLEGAGANAGGDGAAWIRSYQFHRKKGEGTYTCVRRLLDEVRWRVFIREGVAVIASEPALARGLPALALTSELLDQDDFEQHRALRVGEATLKAWLGRYDADPGETVQIDTVPQLGDAQWIIATATVDLMADLGPVEIACRQPQTPLQEPSSEVEQRSADESSDGGGGARGRVYDECKRISDAGGSYKLGGGHGPKLSTLGSGDRLDCSSSCSLALFRAGAFGERTVAIVSGEFASSYGTPGRGSDWTVYANGDHVFIQGDGWRFDTGGPDGGNGPRVHDETRPTTGFTPRRMGGH